VKGWQTKTLSEVCSIDKYQGIHSGIPYVGLEDIESNTAKFMGSGEPQTVKSATFKFSPNHILYGRLRPYLNKVFAPDFVGHCSTEIFPIKPTPNLLREFLVYWFLAEETVKRIGATCTGARMPRADMNQVMAFDFLLPPLAEQRRIVGVLDEAFAGLETLRANAEKNLQNARALFESKLEAIVADAWREFPIVALDNLATDITDGDHMPPPKSASGVPFITIGNIDKITRTIDFEDTFTVPTSYHQNLKSNRRPRKGDVLYTVTGSFGIPVLIDFERDFCFQRHIGLVRPKAEVESAWLAYLLLSPQVFRQAEQGATGTAQKTVSLKTLRNIGVPNASARFRADGVATLDFFSSETQRLAAVYQRKLDALDELKKSLLHEAFAGKL